MKTYKILALFSSYHSRNYKGAVGGGEISNRMLLEGLARKGWQVEVIASDTDIDKCFRGVRVHRTKSSSFSLVSTLRQRDELRKLALSVSRNFQPDVVLSATNSLGFAQEVASISGARHGLVVRAFENFQNLDKRSSLFSRARQKMKVIIRGDNQVANNPADFYVFNSFFMKEKLSSCVGGSSYVVYPPLDLNQNYKEIKKIKNVGVVGLTPEKGIGIVSEVAKRLPDLCFSVYGKRSKSIGDSDLPSNVSYKGWAPASVIYEGSDIFLVPSQWEEPFGRVAVEGISHGCIVLVSDKGGLPEAVSSNPKLVVKGSDPSAWVDRILDIVGDPEKYLSCINEESQNLAKYSLSAQLEEFESLLVEQVQFSGH